MRRLSLVRDAVRIDCDREGGYATPVGRPRRPRRRHLDLAEPKDGALAGVEDLGGAEQRSKRRDVASECVKRSCRVISFWIRRAPFSCVLDCRIGGLICKNIRLKLNFSKPVRRMHSPMNKPHIIYYPKCHR